MFPGQQHGLVPRLPQRLPGAPGIERHGLRQGHAAGADAEKHGVAVIHDAEVVAWHRSLQPHRADRPAAAGRVEHHCRETIGPRVGQPVFKQRHIRQLRGRPLLGAAGEDVQLAFCCEGLERQFGEGIGLRREPGDHQRPRGGQAGRDLIVGCQAVALKEQRHLQHLVLRGIYFKGQPLGHARLEIELPTRQRQPADLWLQHRRARSVRARIQCHLHVGLIAGMGERQLLD